MAPFGFKGGYLTEAWQASVRLADAAGHEGVGLATQSVLWSDSGVFCANSESAGNAMMFLATARAGELARATDWQTPLDLQEKILPDLVAYAKTVTGRKDLRLTFVLNALVALDNAAWVLYARARGMAGFDAMIPEQFRPALSLRNRRIALVPLLSYGVKPDQIQAILRKGYPLLKIKIGSDPAGDGDPEKMLEWDIRRMREIHDLADGMETPHTDSGRISYYLDANGRYPSRDLLSRFLDAARAMGALERILILEEPFPEEKPIDVTGLPVRIAADESAHSEADVLERIHLGYRAIALKPIAKTLSMTLKMLKVAHEKGVPCFCADLTVTPILVEWNKNVAARIAALPGMKTGVVETNGAQNYRNWADLCKRHPFEGRPWTNPIDGVFELDDEFYSVSGGILADSPYYSKRLRPMK